MRTHSLLAPPRSAYHNLQLAQNKRIPLKWVEKKLRNFSAVRDEKNQLINHEYGCNFYELLTWVSLLIAHKNHNFSVYTIYANFLFCVCVCV